MHASAKTMLRETKTKRHRCEFADSVDSKSKRRKRAQQHRLQERMLQVNRQGDWRDVVVRVGPKVHLPERRINRCFSKSIAEGIRCGPTKELRLNPTGILKQRNLIRDAKKTKKSETKLQKNFLTSLLTTAASDFKKNNNEVLGNHYKMNKKILLPLFLKNPLTINKKSEPGG